MSTDSGTQAFASRAEESRFLRMKLERIEREAAALRADRDALAEALSMCINSMNACEELTHNATIMEASAALAKHGGGK